MLAPSMLVECADDFLTRLFEGVARQEHGRGREPEQVAQQSVRHDAIHGVALPGLPKLAM